MTLAKSIEIIARCAPWLEDITLGPLQNHYPFELHHFGKLYCLKSPQFLLDPVLPLMNVINDAEIQIDRLELWYVNVTTPIIKQLRNMISIKKLTIFSYNITDTHLKMIAENLPFLSELRLAHSVHITVNRLANMLCSAQNLKVLHLTNMKNINEANEQHLQTVMKQAKLSIQIDNF